MDNLSVSKRNKLRDREINKRVNDMFKRAHKIRRIRRNKKIKNWIINCLNKQLKTKSDE